MDILTNKQTANYNYTCRYTGIPYYFNTEDKKYIYGLSKNLDKTTEYYTHKLTQTDTLDSLALKYYNNPTLYWVIALFNDVQDIFEPLLANNKTTIKIPNISSIKFTYGR